MITKEHPYILLDNNLVLEIRGRLNSRAYYDKYTNLLKTCNNYIKSTPQYGSEPRWFCNTSRYKESLRQKPLYLALAYVLSGEDKYAEEAKREIFNLLENVVGTEYILGQELDHDAGIIAGTIGIIYDWLYVYLNEEDRNKIKNGLILRLLEVYFDSMVSNKYEWQNSISISNPIINSGMGIAIMSVYNEWNTAKKAFELCYKSIRDNFFEQLPDDGGFPYGINNWRYSMAQAFLFINTMYSATGTDNGILNIKGVQCSCLYPIFAAPLGQPLGFGDFSTRFHPKYDYTNWIFYYLSAIFKEPAFAYYRNVSSLNPDPLELLWNYQVSEDYIPDFPNNRLFKSLETFIVSNGILAEDHIVLGFKNGSNSTYQAHKDLNSFVLKAYGQTLLCELGSEKPAQNSDNDDYYISSQSHNCILINGKGQISSQGKIVGYEETDDFLIITGDASQSYGEQIKIFKRHMIFVDNRYFLLIDEIKATEAVDINWIFHTLGEIQNDDKEIIIQQKSAGLKMCFNSIYNLGLKKENNILSPTPEFEYHRKETIVTCYTEEKVKDTVFAAIMYPFKGTPPGLQSRINLSSERVIFELNSENEQVLIKYSIETGLVEKIQEI